MIKNGQKGAPFVRFVVCQFIKCTYGDCPYSCTFFKVVPEEIRILTSILQLVNLGKVRNELQKLVTLITITSVVEHCLHLIYH